MRIAFVVHSLGAGGAERVVALLTGALITRGHEVMVMTLAARQADFHQVHPRAKRVDLGTRRRAGLDPIANLRRMMRLRASALQFRADVLISFITQANILSLLAMRGTGVPVVISERIDPRVHPEHWFWRALRRLTYRRAAKLVVQTDAVRAWAESIVGGGNVAVIPNPVARAEPETSDEGGETAAFIAGMGRLAHQKGFDLLIRAFALLRERYPDLRLVILGEGPQRDELIALASDLGMQGSVSLPGVRERPFEILRNARVFVLSSRYEGFPNVLLEAMSCGLPVVAFDCPSGPAEIIRDRHDGLLVAPQDVPALAAAVGRLLEDPDLRRCLSARAREVTERFASERIVRCWLQVLEADE